VKNRTDGKPWATDGPYSNVMGMEPDFPCCTVNHPQAWPKFWANSFLLAENGTALVHALLGPATIATRLASGTSVNGECFRRDVGAAVLMMRVVTVDTLYPFGQTLEYRIGASAPFTFYVRIPGWAKSGSTLSVNGQPAAALSQDLKSSLQAVAVQAGETVVELYLDMEVEIEPRANGSIAVHRGPLFYAVDLAYNETLRPAMRASGPLRLLNTLPGVPESDLQLYDNHTHDHDWLPTVPWNIALDPATLAFHSQPPANSTLPYYVWATGAQPQWLTAAACEIEWPLADGDPDWPPRSPNECTGEPFEVTLRPFGGTRLRVGEIPTMLVAG